MNWPVLQAASMFIYGSVTVKLTVKRRCFALHAKALSLALRAVIHLMSDLFRDLHT